MKSLKEVLSDQIKVRVAASKSGDIDKAVDTVSKVINHVNNMTEDGLVGSYPLSSFKIPSQFSGLILPFNICLVERGGKNLKSTKTNQEITVKPSEFEDAWHIILSALRSDGSITKSLSDCTDTKYLSKDLCFRIGEACHYVKGQYPVELTDELKFAFKDFYFDSEPDDVFTEFIRDIVMAVAKSTNN